MAEEQLRCDATRHSSEHLPFLLAHRATVGYVMTPHQHGAFTTIPARRQQCWTFRTRGSALNRAQSTFCASVGTVNSEKDKAESVTPTSLHRPSLVKASPWPGHPDHGLMRVVLGWDHFLRGAFFSLEAFRSSAASRS